MNFELTGTIKVIQEPQTFASGFSKRELVLTVPEGNYPQDISFEFLKEKADLLNDLKVGDEITVFFNIRGREYNGRYFNNLTGWKLQEISKQPEYSAEPKSSAPLQEPDIDDMDDIPF